MGIDRDLFSYSNGRFSKTVRSDGKPTGMVVGMAEDASRFIWIITTAKESLLRLDPKIRVADSAENASTKQDHEQSPWDGLFAVVSFW